MQRAGRHAVADTHFVPERITARGDRRDEEYPNELV